jgi:hypothetical protein
MMEGIRNVVEFYGVPNVGNFCSASYVPAPAPPYACADENGGSDADAIGSNYDGVPFCQCGGDMTGDGITCV